MTTREDAAVAHARATLFGRLGLIQGCKTILHSAGEPRLHAVSAVAATGTEVYMRANLVEDYGAVGFTWEQAFLGAVGECVERYCCAWYDPDQMVYASQNDLGDRAIGLDAFGIYSPELYDTPNFPFARFLPDRPISWVKGTSLLSGEPRYVPACLVYVPFFPRDRDDFLALSVSSGQACHTTRERALVTGLYEVIERDAFMISWLRRLQLPRVDYLADPELAQIYRRYFDGCNLRFNVFDMTLDVKIPSMMCIVEADSARGPMIGMGAATRLSPREAVKKALLEAAQDMVWCRDLLRRKPDWRPQPDWSNIQDFEDHVRLYCEPEMKHHVDFLLSSPRRVTLPGREDAPEDFEAALGRCLELVKEQGLDCIAVDTTAPEIAAAGFYGPKVLIPGAVPLTAIHRLPAHGSPRLWSAPSRAGFGDEASPELNPIPHPFP